VQYCVHRGETGDFPRHAGGLPQLIDAWTSRGWPIADPRGLSPGNDCWNAQSAQRPLRTWGIFNQWMVRPSITDQWYRARPSRCRNRKRRTQGSSRERGSGSVGADRSLDNFSPVDRDPAKKDKTVP